MNDDTKVLFLCQHNAGRSQLGAHLLEYVAPGRFGADSAGIAPATEINPVVAEALRELDIDTSAATPRPVTAEELATVDVVVAMKPGLALPGPVAGRLVEWEFPNPESWDLEGVRGLRDDILRSVQGLARKLSDQPGIKRERQSEA